MSVKVIRHLSAFLYCRNIFGVTSVMNSVLTEVKASSMEFLKGFSVLLLCQLAGEGLSIFFDLTLSVLYARACFYSVARL